jgi:hypothetical protein
MHFSIQIHGAESGNCTGMPFSIQSHGAESGNCTGMSFSIQSHGAESGNCISACYVMSELWIWIIKFYEQVLIYTNQGIEWEKYMYMLYFVQSPICIRKQFILFLMPYSQNYGPTQWCTEYLCKIHTEFMRITWHSMPPPPCTYIHCEISCWILCFSSPSHLLACVGRRVPAGDWLV